MLLFNISKTIFICTFLLLMSSANYTIKAQVINEAEIIGEAVISRTCTGLRAEPSITSDIIFRPESGQTVQLFDFYKKPYVKAKIGDVVGYFSSMCLVSSDIVQRLIHSDDPELLELIERYGASSPEVKFRGNNKRIRFVKKYGETYGIRISNSEIWIGMTEEMLLDSWGRPNNKNITETAFGRSEQWVYNRGQFRSDYVYLDKGIVSTIQYSE